ncbi:HAD-IA family hydrolase [Candidatus Woesebacteria bacterium]|nr:HAD-IA family hydrolase [Candidatus Woesebacteria bacterium]
MSKQFSTYIFDFDGTIADTLFTVIRIINNNKEHYGIDGIDETEIPRFRNMSVRYLLKEFNIHLVQVPKFLRDIQKELGNHISEVKCFLDMDTVMQTLKKKGAHVGIVTSNTEKNVSQFLFRHKLEKIPSFVIAEPSLFGKHKKIKKAVEKYHLNPQKTIYIGDEIRDIEAANKAGVASGVVTWGYNGKEILSKHHPDYLFDSPKQIVSLIE